MASIIMDKSLLPVTRREALATGATHYFTGIPCKRGHVEPRSAIRRHCPVCAELLYKSEDQLSKARSRYRAGGEAAKARSRKWQLENPDAHKEAVRAWTKANARKSVEYANRRRALKSENGGDHTAADVSALAVMQKFRCAYCSRSIKKSFEIDHIMPLARGGRNDRKNLQLLCTTCNRRKGFKHPVDWANEIGLLL